jgi:acyl dehydratase
MEGRNMDAPALSIATLPQWVGKELGVSGWVRIDQQRIDEFAHCTGDHQWIHVDVERARKESPFGTTIAHGYLTVSMLAHFSFEIFVRPAGITQALNYGSDKVRFINPVKCGARIRDRIVLAGAEDKGGRWLVTMEHTVEIEGEAKPALVATTLAMVLG